MRLRQGLIFALCLLPCLAPPAWPAGDEGEDATDCDRLGAARPASHDTQATDEDRVAFRGATTESCLGLIYGPKRDLDQGRRCCLVLGRCNRELAVIFANGWGVRRNYDAAAWYLCHAEDEMAPDEQSGMLEHLDGMRHARRPRDLDYCEETTSGLGAGWCEKLKFDRLQVGWQQRMDVVGRKLGDRARRALADLQAAAYAFIAEDAGFPSEGDKGGTLRAAQEISDQEAATAAFVADLERLTRSRAPAVTAAVRRRREEALSEAYSTAEAALKHCRGCASSYASGAGTDDLRQNQVLWIKLRDAWIGFYSARWQGAAPAEDLEREISTLMTRRRAAQLRQLSAPE